MTKAKTETTTDPAATPVKLSAILPTVKTTKCDLFFGATLAGTIEEVGSLTILSLDVDGVTWEGPVPSLKGAKEWAIALLVKAGK